MLVAEVLVLRALESLDLEPGLLARSLASCDRAPRLGLAWRGGEKMVGRPRLALRKEATDKGIAETALELQDATAR